MRTKTSRSTPIRPRSARTKVVGVYLPPALATALRIRAAEMDDSVSALLERGARLVLRETEDRAGKKRAEAEAAIGVGAVTVEKRTGT